MFEKIKKWYEMKLWTKEMVHNALLKNIITEEQYKEIIYESNIYFKNKGSGSFISE